MVITLYLSPTSPPCRTVLFVAKHLNIELNEKVVDMRNKEHLTPEFLKLNPRHSVPTLVDNGLSVWESRAIAQYLCNKYAPDSDLYPKDADRRAKVDLVLNFDLGSLGPTLRNSLFAKAYRGVEPNEQQLQDLNTSLKVLDALIAANGGYVAGNHVTIADLSLLANTTVFAILDYDLSDFPNLDKWYKQLPKELPYFQEINAKALEALKRRAEASKSN